MLARKHQILRYACVETNICKSKFIVIQHFASLELDDFGLSTVKQGVFLQALYKQHKPQS
ncbi:MAG: hypothetical protein B7C24_00690 [Bacteroidetes bacterium 4572_77]|nr:MAG: hypothetical protein B7C24_00690 [Bacteroidetes bacterium 4572_77]